MNNVIGIDLGGTKVTGAIFDKNGIIVKKSSSLLEKREGKEVGKLILDLIDELLNYLGGTSGIVSAVGVCVPGIADVKTGMVWAPNIPGWEDYPLQREIETHLKKQNTRV